jgi:fructokinase
MSTFISKKCKNPLSIGIAAFGPLCLDKTSKAYGSITTTPKLAWQNVKVYDHFKKTHGLNFKQIFIDTDCNVCAMYEFKNSGA